MATKKQQLPATLTRVTGFSKLIALLLFIILVFGAFYAGMKFQEKVDRSMTIEMSR